jgi:hypothetical protein
MIGAAAAPSGLAGRRAPGLGSARPANHVCTEVASEVQDLLLGNLAMLARSGV